MADVDVEPPAAEAAPTFVTETPASAVPDEAPAKQTGAPKAVVKAVLPKAGIKLVHDLALEPKNLIEKRRTLNIQRPTPSMLLRSQPFDRAYSTFS